MEECYDHTTTATLQMNAEEKIDLSLAYGLVILWVCVQLLMRLPFFWLNRRFLRVPSIVGSYIQAWNMAALGILILSFVVVITRDYPLSNLLTAVTAKTIGFLLLDKAPVPSRYVSNALQTIWETPRVKIGDSRGRKIKFAVVYLRQPKWRSVWKAVQDMSFRPGNWRGVWKMQTEDGEEYVYNSADAKDQNRRFDESQLHRLYTLKGLQALRETTGSVGVIFTDKDPRIDERLTGKGWFKILNDECGGLWERLVARQLQALVPTEVLIQPVIGENSLDSFKSSNVYGRWRKLYFMGEDYPALRAPLTDVRLFEAVVYESFRSRKSLDVSRLTTPLFDNSLTPPAMAVLIFAWMCEI